MEDKEIEKFKKQGWVNLKDWEDSNFIQFNCSPDTLKEVIAQAKDANRYKKALEEIDQGPLNIAQSTILRSALKGDK